MKQRQQRIGPSDFYPHDPKGRERHRQAIADGSAYAPLGPEIDTPAPSSSGRGVARFTAPAVVVAQPFESTPPSASLPGPAPSGGAFWVRYWPNPAAKWRPVAGDPYHPLVTGKQLRAAELAAVARDANLGPGAVGALIEAFAGGKLKTTAQLSLALCLARAAQMALHERGALALIPSGRGQTFPSPDSSAMRAALCLSLGQLVANATAPPGPQDADPESKRNGASAMLRHLGQLLRVDPPGVESLDDQAEARIEQVVEEAVEVPA